LTWRYVPPWFMPGFALFLGAAALILLLVTGQLLLAGRRAGRSQRAQPMMYPVRLIRPARPARLPPPAEEQDRPTAAPTQGQDGPPAAPAHLDHDCDLPK